MDKFTSISIANMMVCGAFIRLMVAPMPLVAFAFAGAIFFWGLVFMCFNDAAQRQTLKEFLDSQEDPTKEDRLARIERANESLVKALAELDLRISSIQSAMGLKALNGR